MAQRNENNDKNKLTPILVAIVTIIMAGGYGLLYWWVFMMTVAEGEPAFPILILTALPIAVVVGVIIAARQRMKEIDDGELDEAKKY